jgi:hypothetical protein
MHSIAGRTPLRRSGWPRLSAFLILGCSGASEPSDVPAALELISGDQQVLAPEMDAAPLIVRAIDDEGRPVPDVLVTFSVPPEAGAFVSEGISHQTRTVPTRADGIASLRWQTTGLPLPDSAILTARATGLEPVRFVAHLYFPRPAGATTLAAASFTSCAMISANRVVCWHGFNTNSGLAWPGVPVSMIAAGAGGYCAVASDGRYCWPDRHIFHVPAFGEELHPQHIDAGIEFATITGECGLDRTAFMYCWSTTSDLTLRGGDADGTPQLHPDLRFRQIAEGHGFVCGVSGDRRIICTGDNTLGQLGGPTADPWYSYLDGPYVGVAAGYAHACGLRQDGVALCWGRNSEGQLGNGTTTGSQVPLPVSGSLRFASITAGSWNTCGIAANGRAFCWGANETGILGNGGSTASRAPVAVQGNFSFAELAVGIQHACGRTIEGPIVCWGEIFGPVPVEVPIQ